MTWQYYRAGSIECQTTACTCACIVHSAGRASALGLVLVWIRIRVSMMGFFFVFWVWTRRPRTIFPFPNLLSAPQVRLTATDVDRRSPRPGTMSLFLSQSRSALNTHKAALAYYDFEKGRKTSRQATDKWPDKTFLRSSSSISPELAQIAIAAGCSTATSLATANTGTVLLPSQVSQIAGHAPVIMHVQISSDRFASNGLKGILDRWFHFCPLQRTISSGTVQENTPGVNDNFTFFFNDILPGNITKTTCSKENRISSLIRSPLTPQASQKRAQSGCFSLCLLSNFSLETCLQKNKR